MCQKLGIETNQDINKMAVTLADFLLAEMDRDDEDPSVMVEAFAPKKRKEVWRKIAIYPTG